MWLLCHLELTVRSTFESIATVPSSVSIFSQISLTLVFVSLHDVVLVLGSLVLTRQAGSVFSVHVPIRSVFNVELELSDWVTIVQL